jgi:hypothetical protein
MAPAATSDLLVHSAPAEKKSFPAPLKLSGALDKFTFEDTTPLIGRELVNVNIVDDLLRAANSDELLRDLAITSEHIRQPPCRFSPRDSLTIASITLQSLPARRGLFPRSRQPHR